MKKQYRISSGVSNLALALSAHGRLDVALQLASQLASSLDILMDSATGRQTCCRAEVWWTKVGGLFCSFPNVSRYGETV